MHKEEGFGHVLGELEAHGPSQVLNEVLLIVEQGAEGHVVHHVAEGIRADSYKRANESQHECEQTISVPFNWTIFGCLRMLIVVASRRSSRKDLDLTCSLLSERTMSSLRATTSLSSRPRYTTAKPPKQIMSKMM